MFSTSLSQFSAHWASWHFHCAGFSSYSASTVGPFTKLGLLCVWPPPHGDQAKVVSARLNPRNGTIYVGGVCNFSSVLSHHSKNLKQRTNQCYSSVFLGKTKDSMPSGSEGELTQKTKKREASIFLGFLLLYIYLLPHEPALCKLC